MKRKMYMSEKKRTAGTRNRAPTHPGVILRYDYLEPLSVPVSQMAERLKVSRKTMSKIVNGKGSVTPDMALRLSKAFGTTPDLWLNLQKNYDLWQARKSEEWREIQPFEIPPDQQGIPLESP